MTKMTAIFLIIIACCCCGIVVEQKRKPKPGEWYQIQEMEIPQKLKVKVYTK